jgi:ribonuclease VapC
VILDTSVIVALALGEPEYPAFLRAMDQASSRRLSAGSWIELSAVAVRGKLVGIEWLDRAREHYTIEIVPVSVEQAQIGHLAYRAFGIGSGSKAKLNFGDCFSYALSKATGEPLLFKGDDFTHTDVLRAAYEPS